MVGVFTQRALNNILGDTDFCMKVDFRGGRKTGKCRENSWSKIAINQSQPLHKPRIKPGLQWWEVSMMTTAPIRPP